MPKSFSKSQISSQTSSSRGPLQKPLSHSTLQKPSSSGPSGSKTLWPQPSISDLKRAALGKAADSLDDDELDAYAASLLVKEAAKKSSSHGYIMEPEEPKIANTNKTFLANTIRNTSSYNRALLKREAMQKETPPTKKLAKKRKQESDAGDASGRSRTKSFNLLDDLDPLRQESMKRLGALSSHSKLKTRAKPTIKSLDPILYGADEGVYGPIKRPGKELPMSNDEIRTMQDLPQKCPW